MGTRAPPGTRGLYNRVFGPDVRAWVPVGTHGWVIPAPTAAWNNSRLPGVIDVAALAEEVTANLRKLDNA